MEPRWTVGGQRWGRRGCKGLRTVVTNVYSIHDKGALRRRGACVYYISGALCRKVYCVEGKEGGGGGVGSFRAGCRLGRKLNDQNRREQEH